MSNLSEEVRDFLSTTKISQEDLARMSGLSLSTVNNVKNADPGQSFSDRTETQLREAMDRYRRDLSSVLAGQPAGLEAALSRAPKEVREAVERILEPYREDE